MWIMTAEGWKPIYVKTVNHNQNTRGDTLLHSVGFTDLGIERLEEFHAQALTGRFMSNREWPISKFMHAMKTGQF